MTRPPHPRTRRPDGPRDGKGDRAASGPGKPSGPRNPSGPRPPADPRRMAQTLLTAVLEEGRSLADLTGRAGPLARLSPPERARTQRLATETLRNLGGCDAILGRFVDRLPPLPVLNVLRMATYELCTGEAAHGVVNSAVTMVAAMPRHNRMKGLTNAVLRKVADQGPALWPDRAPTRLTDWLRDPLVMAWGAPDVAAMEAAHTRGADLDITPRDPGEAQALADELGARLLPTGTLRLAGNVQVSALPGFAEGRWWVQDAAAALPAAILAPAPGERVLDLCAAPGGKTMQLAARGAAVTAVDISAARTERVQENLARTGLTATIAIADALDFGESGWDAILLDAPCSATGTIRRHPDLPHGRQADIIGDLIDLQSRLIDHALNLLKPGGRLVFSTCSLIPDEGEVQAEEALARHPGLLADRSALALPGLDPAWITEEGGLRLRPDLWPELGGMDGFYVVVLRKAA